MRQAGNDRAKSCQSFIAVIHWDGHKLQVLWDLQQREALSELLTLLQTLTALITQKLTAK